MVTMKTSREPTTTEGVTRTLKELVLARTRKVTQQDIARRAGIHQWHLQAVMRGVVRNPTLKTVRGLAIALGVTQLQIRESIAATPSASSMLHSIYLKPNSATAYNLSSEKTKATKIVSGVAKARK